MTENTFLQVDVVPLEKVPEVIHQYHLCVVKNCRFDSALIAKATQLKLLMQFGVGLEGSKIASSSFFFYFALKIAQNSYFTQKKVQN